MKNMTSAAYFKQLSYLLQNLQITDPSGNILALDEGSNLAVTMIAALQDKIKKAMIIGNGGSAAIAAHLQTDLVNSAGIKAMVFTQSSTLTALANDKGYDSVYEQPVELWAQTGDLLLAISSSGQSENILNAVFAAKRKKCKIITMSGFRKNNPLRNLGDLNFFVSSRSYGLVELAHSIIAHFLADAVVNQLSEKRKSMQSMLVSY